MALLVIMKAEMKRRWPEQSRAVKRRALRRWRRYRAAKATGMRGCVRWRVCALKFAKGVEGGGGTAVDVGQANERVASLERNLAFSSCP